MKKNVEIQEVKVCRLQIDLLNLQNYMDRFLALKNHERNTREILEVTGINGSNCVDVTMLIDEDEDEAKEIKSCEDFVGQFGKFSGKSYIDTAYIIEKDWQLDSLLDYQDLYIY